MTDTPEPSDQSPPQTPAASPTPPRDQPAQPSPVEAPAAQRPQLQLPWTPIAIVGAVVIVLALGMFAWRAFTPPRPDESAYVVQPYTPSSELITARDRVEARSEPDAASRVVVIFGQGVTLNVSGRVSRGLGNDWYAISWNDRTAFVRTQDAAAGSGAPPAPIVRERPPRLEAKEDEKPEELTEPQGQQVVEARPSGALSIGDVNWIREPNARDFARFFPHRALNDGRSGSVTLSCIIGRRGQLACSVASENPAGYGFGQAGIAISRQLRVRTTLPDGSPAEGREMRLPLSFRAG